MGGRPVRGGVNKSRPRGQKMEGMRGSREGNMDKWERERGRRAAKGGGARKDGN